MAFSLCQPLSRDGQATGLHRTGSKPAGCAGIPALADGYLELARRLLARGTGVPTVCARARG